MRNPLLFIVPLIALSVFSCAQPGNEQDELQKSKQLAVEMISREVIELASEPLNEVEYADFISPDVAKLMSQSRVYSQRSLMTRSGEDDSTDTLYFAEQIPMIREEFEQIKIYSDGTMESVYTTDLDPDEDPILSCYDTPLDLDQYAARVEVKNGTRITYGKSGAVLHREPCETFDMTEYLETLTQFVEEAEQESVTRAGQKRDVEWLRRKMASRPKTRSGQSDYYNIEVLPNGNVVLEQEVVEEAEGLVTRGISPSGRLVTRTELSPDISRPMGYELRSGNALLERRKYAYSESNPATRSMYGQNSAIEDVNPEEIVSERLVVMQDGTPMIEVKTETYSQNQTIFHFNNKK